MTGASLHLFLTGEIQVGKSTIVSSVVSRLGVPVSGCGRFFVRPGFSVFFRCLLSTVYCLLLFGAGSAVRFFGCVVFFSVFLVSGAFVFPRTFLRFCLAVFIIFVNFAVFVNFSDNF